MVFAHSASRVGETVIRNGVPSYVVAGWAATPLHVKYIDTILLPNVSSFSPRLGPVHEATRVQARTAPARARARPISSRSSI